MEWYHCKRPWVTFYPDFKVTTFVNIEYLRYDPRQSHSYYRTSIGSHMRSIAWWQFQWPWRTANPVFKVMAFLKSIISNALRFTDSFYRTLIGNHTESIEWSTFTWAAQPGCVGGGQCPSHFWDQRGTGGIEGRSNENDLCFYSRQSLFSTVQVTEFQLPWL